MVSLNSCALCDVEIQIYRCSVTLGSSVVVNSAQDQVQNGTLLKTQEWAMNQKGRVSLRTVEPEDSLDLHCG